jgi:hypothetical protein
MGSNRKVNGNVYCLLDMEQSTGGKQNEWRMEITNAYEIGM